MPRARLSRRRRGKALLCAGAGPIHLHAGVARETAEPSQMAVAVLREWTSCRSETLWEHGLYLTICAPAFWRATGWSAVFVARYIYSKIAELMDTMLAVRMPPGFDADRGSHRKERGA